MKNTLKKKNFQDFLLPTIIQAAHITSKTLDYLGMKIQEC